MTQRLRRPLMIDREFAKYEATLVTFWLCSSSSAGSSSSASRRAGEARPRTRPCRRGEAASRHPSVTSFVGCAASGAHAVPTAGRSSSGKRTECGARPRPEPREVSGRTWDRNERDEDRLEATEVDFSRLLQGLLVDADGRPISLSTTHFYSAVGQIWDKLAGSEVVRELALAALRELVRR